MKERNSMALNDRSFLTAAHGKPGGGSIKSSRLKGCPISVILDGINRMEDDSALITEKKMSKIKEDYIRLETVYNRWAGTCSCVRSKACVRRGALNMGISAIVSAPTGRPST